MEQSPLKIAVYIAVAVAIVLATSSLFTKTEEEQRPYRIIDLSFSFIGLMDHYSKQDYVVDAGLSFYFSGTECAEYSGLSSCFKIITEELNKSRLKTNPYQLRDIEAAVYCQNIINEIVKNCYDEQESVKCDYSQEKYLGECYKNPFPHIK